MKDIPLTVSSQYLFESNDQSAISLFTKVEAWLNFQALRNNWFGDESKIVEIDFIFLPEGKFLSKQIDVHWHSIQRTDAVAVYGNDKAELEYQCFIMLSNEELKHLMSHPKELEATLTGKLKSVVNEIAKPLDLVAI